MDGFRDALNRCDLRDLGFEGDIFTWRNHSKELQTYICERLDRATANEHWCEKFPNFAVINGEPRHSDHRPIIVCTEGYDRGWSKGDTGFHFEAKWLREEGCREVIQGAWEESRNMGEGGVAQNLRSVAGRLTIWNKEVVGELDSRLKQARRDLEKCMCDPVSVEKIAKEARLRRTVEELEQKKHIHYKQRAHMWWLRDGNRNTGYLKSIATARKKANRIKELRKEDGEVVKEEEELTNYVCSFFRIYSPHKRVIEHLNSLKR